jgi:hypothetical protein
MSNETQKYNLHDSAWKMMSEVRHEIIQDKNIRNQIIGFKITFVGVASGVIVANTNRISNKFMVIILSTFLLILFDLMISAYDSKIKRAGVYCKYLEDFICPQDSSSLKQEKSENNANNNLLLWEQYLLHIKPNKNIALTAKLSRYGLTAIFTLFAVIVIYF